MRITIDIPDWAAKRHIYIMAGIEMLAYKPYGEDTLYVKVERCAGCGGCCSDLKVCVEPIGPDNNCVWLSKEPGTLNECLLGEQRPFICSTTRSEKGRTPGCSIEYRREIVE